MKVILFPLVLKMPVDLTQFRAAVGLFHSRSLLKLGPFFNFKNNFGYFIFLLTSIGLLNFCCIMLWYFLFLIRLSGDIKMSPSSKSSKTQSLSICHWNVNSLPAHNFIKSSLLSAFLGIEPFDIVCISETYLNSEIGSEDDRLQILGYSLIPCDHPSNGKRGGRTKQKTTCALC